MRISTPAADAALAAREELRSWSDLADQADRLLVGWDDLRPVEVAVVEVYNPAFDLQRRADKWSHKFKAGELPELLRFLAGLALIEAESWESDNPEIATQAIAERRFFFGDRVVHWAIPWLESVRIWDRSRSELANDVQHRLLELGELHRPNPELVDTEGMTAPGEDLFGPLKTPPPTSLLAGVVVLDKALSAWGSSRSSIHGDVPEGYHSWRETCAERWETLRASHEGTGALWRDLSARARS